MAKIYRVLTFRKEGRAFHPIAASPWIVSAVQAQQVKTSVNGTKATDEMVSVEEMEVPTGRADFTQWLNAFQEEQGLGANLKKIVVEPSTEIPGGLADSEPAVATWSD